MATEFGKSMEDCGKKNNQNGKINKKKKRGGRKSGKSKEVTPSTSTVTVTVAPPPSAILQSLYVTCRDVFKDPDTVPSPFDVQKICHIIDNMTPQDVGLCQQVEFFNTSSIFEEFPIVTCCPIYQCKNFSLCVFFLPKNAVIPLHNHPGMTVFSKLLAGKMHIKAYDWVDPVESHDSSTPSGKRLAKLKANRVFSAPCDTTVLYPTTGGNIHEFKAIKPCAVLDVIGPPYSRQEGRDCSYYKDTPYSPLSSGGPVIAKEEAKMYGWLEEIEPPEESQMLKMEYTGPQVIETE